MNLQILIKKCKSYPVASVAISVTIILILGIYVRGLAQADLQERFDEATRNWNRMEENVFKNSVNLETHLENAAAISQDVRERLIRPSQLAQNYQYFYRLETATGVQIQNLQQHPVAARPAERGEAREQALFSKVEYSMNVAGGFSQTLDLLQALEHGPHFYQLKTFALQRGAGADRRDINLLLSFELLGTP